MINRMKTRNSLLVLFLLCSTLCFAQDKLFEKYADKDNVTSVYISKSMFQMMPDNMRAGGLDLGNLKGKIHNLQILTSENKEVKQQMKADFDAVVGKDHELLMKVKSDDTRASFFVKQKGEKISELIMLTDDEEDYVVMRLTGDFTIQDIRQIAEEVEK